MSGQHEFPPSERLTRKTDFEFVFRRGDKLVDRHLISYLVRREQEDTRKLGLAVSRKVGKAVVRNRVKRYIRESYRSLRPSMASSFWLVVVARPSAAQAGYGETCEAMRRMLIRGGVLDG